MKSKFLNREDSGRLILIFAGWSTDADFYSDIAVEGWDVLVVWDYSDSNFDRTVLDQYHTIALFAWSLGVFAAANTIPFDKIAISVAINGTEFPVDDSIGIPRSIFFGTLDNLDTRSLQKFQKRMCGDKFIELKDRFAHTPDIDNLKKQLSFIATQYPGNDTFHPIWNRVYISSKDAIFPPANQKKAWENHTSLPEIVFLEDFHCIDLFSMIKSIIPSKEKVAQRFRNALPTYDENAPAQKEVALYLANLITENMGRDSLGKVVEIGSGSGIFTRYFTRSCSVPELTFVDLYPLPRYDVAEKENYIVGDAEEWAAEEAERNPKGYDAIVSASAMQWFVNPESFARNVARLLQPDGFFAAATYLPGNFGELSVINPFTLLYRKKKDIENIFRKYFPYLILAEDEIRVNFESGREMMRHLCRTGVGGSAGTTAPLKNILERLPNVLTSRPLYIFASFKEPIPNLSPPSGFHKNT